MKAFCFISILLLSFTVNAQKSFDNGWEDGFEAAMLDYEESIYITPISPIVMSNESETYRAGFRRGYGKGLEQLKITNPEFSWRDAYLGMGNSNSAKTKLTFDDGWDAGYNDAMNDNDESIYIIPISPIIMNGQDNYNAGYRKGYRRGVKDLE